MQIISKAYFLDKTKKNVSKCFLLIFYPECQAISWQQNSVGYSIYEINLKAYLEWGEKVYLEWHKNESHP